MLDDYLTNEEVMDKFKISKNTLQKYRSEGKLPYSKFGGSIVYKKTDIVKMLESRTIGGR